MRNGVLIYCTISTAVCTAKVARPHHLRLERIDSAIGMSSGVVTWRIIYGLWSVVYGLLFMVKIFRFSTLASLNTVFTSPMPILWFRVLGLVGELSPSKMVT